MTKPRQRKKRCGAKKRDGSKCRTWAMPNGRCRMHGGTSLKGAAHPAFKHGRYSEALPERLLERYQASQSDPELLAMRDEIGLTDARLGDVLARVDSGENGALWQRVKEHYDELQAGRAAQDVNRMADAIDALGVVISSASTDAAAWAEVGRLIEQRRRLVESERKRMVDLQLMITAERAMALVTALVGVVREHVRDARTLTAISDAFGALLERTDENLVAPPGR